MKLIGQNGNIFNITHQKTLIGRDNVQCQIVLQPPFISRVQAVIEVGQNGQVTLKNLSSRQTTFVNTKPIDVCILNDGDTVDFGAGQIVSFRFQKDDGAIISNEPPPINNSISLQPFSGGETIPFVQKSPIQTAPSQTPPKATSVFRVSLSDKLRIGRAADNDIVLDAPSVSRYHAELIYQNGNEQPVITDLGSTNGILVDGDILRGEKLLSPDEWVTIGGYLLLVKGREIKKKDLSASRLVAYQVSKSYGEKTVLQDISVALYPREFVGLMGSSGCGKSTLMDALNGMRPATNGQVVINDLDLYQNFDLLRRSIGYVPQRDILHEPLSVERTLYFAAKMRLPSQTTSAQINEVINEVIQTVDLQDQRHNAFKQLSGGQQKRLSLGIELITKPNFLFLDEPTSPLDPETTENMMLLFRRLADEGRIVVMVTHKFEKFNSMHQIVLLTKGGRLAFFGPPQEALNYFNCQEPSEIYRRLGERTPEQINQQFLNSQPFQKYVASRFNEMNQKANQDSFNNSQTGAERKFGPRQWLTLTHRYLEIKLQDLKNTLILLVQAPIVALILALITDNTPNDGRTIFIAAVIAIWLGANNAIREVVSETAIYARERLVNLKIPSYILSKFAILSAIGFAQCVLFVFILTVFDKFKVADFPMLILILYLSLLAGISIGLFFSTIVSSTEKAMSILPLILIPQLLLSGFLKPIDDLYVNLKKERPAVVEDYDKYERDKDKEIKIDPKNPDKKPDIPDPVTKSEGLSGIGFLANFITARWTIDALAHQVSINDTEKTRDKIATSMTVVEYKNVLNKESEDFITDAYKSRVRFDLFILAMFSIIFLVLTMVALKQKDSL